MTGRESIVPVYQTLSLWDLVAWGSESWKETFPFDAPRGSWAFTGRVALHVGLPSLGLRPGSTILVPNYFQGVEIDTLLHNGFKLRFYRVDKQLRVDLDHVTNRFDKDVSAFYLIHYFGWPQPLESVSEFCQDHGLRLIEDCALSLFSRDGSRWLGTSGDLAFFSLYKTCGLPHGGYVVSKSGYSPEKLARPPFESTWSQLTELLQQDLRASGWLDMERKISGLARSIRLKPKSSNAVKSGWAHWDPRLLNYSASRWVKYLMKVARPQEIVAARRRNFEHLAKRLAGHVESPFTGLPAGVCPLFFPVMVHDKLSAMNKLAEVGIGSVNLWSESHPACPPDLAAEVSGLRRHLLELPIHQSLTENDIDRVADAFLERVETQAG